MQQIRSEFDTFAAGAKWEKLLRIAADDLGRYVRGEITLCDEAKARLGEARFSLCGIANKFPFSGTRPITALLADQLPNREQYLVKLLIGQAPRLGENQPVSALVERADRAVAILDGVVNEKATPEMAAVLCNLLLGDNNG